MLRSRRVWLGFLLSLVFLGIFLWQTDWSEIRDAFAEANYAIALASLPVYFAGIWVRTIRWQYLLRPIARIRAARLYPVVIIGLTANNLLPARIGELVRAYLVGEREKISKAAAFGTIAVDRLFDGLTLVPMLVITAAFVGVDEEFQLPRIGWTVDLFQLALIMAMLFGVAIVVLFVLAFSPAWRDRADRLLMVLTPKRFEPAVTGLMHSFVDGLAALRSPTDLGVAWVMSGISWLLEATMYYMVGIAFDLDVGFQYYLLVTSAANLAISVFASQGGIGPFELVTKQIMIAAGVSTSLATAYAIGLHALVLIPVIVVGLYFLWTMDLSVGEMFRRSTQSEPDTTKPAVVAPEEVIT